MKTSKLSQLSASVLANAIYAMKNFPIMLLNVMLAPFGLLIIIFFVSHGALLDAGILGSFILVMVNNGISLQGDLTHLRNDMKLQDMLVSSPVSPTIYIIGIALSELVFSVPDLLVLSILAIIFIHMSAITALTLAAVMLLTFMFSISLGFFISTVSRDVVESWAFMGLISMVLSTLPPVYYPVTYIPLPFRYLAYISPTTFSAIIAQGSIGFVKFSGSFVLMSWIILISVSIFLIVFAIKRSKWREE
ncbi:MAG: ABC transporter permease [Candidatus Parvarchaeum sp.]